MPLFSLGQDRLRDGPRRSEGGPKGDGVSTTWSSSPVSYSYRASIDGACWLLEAATVIGVRVEYGIGKLTIRYMIGEQQLGGEPPGANADPAAEAFG